MTTHRGLVSAFTLLVAFAGCAPTPAAVGPAASAPPSATLGPASVAPWATLAPSFPTDAFAGLDEGPVSDALAAELQEVLDTSASGHGLTATLITPQGTWSGATGFAAGDRAMTPDDQMAIASISKTVVAAQVMQLVEAGDLSLDDLAADRLPPDLEFDTNGARIVDLLSMRSGIPQWVIDFEAVTKDPLHLWTADEKLATVAPGRGQVGHDWEYTDTNYLLLGLIIEQVTDQSVGEVLRSGVLGGDRFERLIYQPDERPTEPMALTVEPGATEDAFKNGGGYLPSLAMATMFASAGGMASDSVSVARWLKGLCGGQVVSPASVDEMTDFDARPGYGLGIIDRSDDYWSGSGALGHKGSATTVALCFQDPSSVVVVLANAEHDVDTLAGDLVRAAGT